MILDGICMVYKGSGKSKINSVGMDNMSTELCKNNKKIRNQKVLQVLHFEYTSYPMGSQQSLENSRL